MVQSAHGYKYYRNIEDLEAKPRRPYRPPEIVALLQAAKEWNTQPWILAGVPYSLYWRLSAHAYRDAENEAHATLQREQRPR